MSAAVQAVRALEKRVVDLEAENAALRAAFAGETPDHTAFVFGLRKQEGQVLSVLARRGQASREQLMVVLNGPNAFSMDWKKVDVHVCRLRQKLKRFGLSVQTVWGFGYAMTEDDRAKVRQIMGEAEGK